MSALIHIVAHIFKKATPKTIFLEGVLFLNSGIRRYISVAIFFAGVILFFRYCLPLVLPFLLGAGLAFGAEPLVSFLCHRLKLKRPLATAVGITAAFSFLALAVMVLCAFLIRQLQGLVGMLPQLETILHSSMDKADGWLLTLTGRIPGELGTVLSRNVHSPFAGGDALLGRAMDVVLKLASGILSHVPDSALGLGAGIISSYMISAKLPAIRSWFRTQLSAAQIAPIIGAIRRLKEGLFGWLRAQVRLSGVTFLLGGVAFLILRIPQPLLWAALVAIVDAFPILGTGTVLVPWSIFSFLQGDPVLAFGLLILYGATALTRSVLEPRLLGRQLGLDPLVTLMALYAGYRLWGIGGMLLTPMLAVAATQLLAEHPV